MLLCLSISTNTIELAWAAGFWDGEGFLGLTKARRLVMTCGQSSSFGTPEVLTRFQAALNGLGTIYGPYKRSRPNERDVYTWRATRRQEVIDAITQLRPFLSQVKLAQADVAIASMPPRKRRGKGENLCINGHDITKPDALRIYDYGKYCRLCQT